MPFIENLSVAAAHARRFNSSVMPQVESQMIDMQMVREVVRSKESILAFIDHFIEETFKDKEDNDVNAVLRFWAEHNLISNTNIIFEYAESEIEKIFLNSINVSGAFYDAVFLRFTPPLASIEEDLGAFRSMHDSILDMKRHFERDTGRTKHKEFFDWVGWQDGLPAATRKQIQSNFLMYHGGGLNTSFHVSIQSSIRTFQVTNKYIRPDLFVWLPFNQTFKLLVECDSYQYHLNKRSFVNDRIRDRTLWDRGFNVLRFSGAEIFRDPIGISKEFCDYLASRRPEYEEPETHDQV